MQNPIRTAFMRFGHGWKQLRYRPRMIVLVTLMIDCLVVALFVGRTLVVAQDLRDRNPPTTNRAAVVDGNTTFAFDLYHQLASEQDGNLIFSPYSISLNMAMLYAGAKGETAQQMADVLHFKLPPAQFHPAFNALDLALKRTQDEPLILFPTATNLYDLSPADDLTLTIANGLWTQTGFPIEKNYVDTLQKNYGVGLNQTDFSANPDAAQQTISHWVEENTRGRIKDIPTPGTITSQTRLALINAIYFKGEWMYPFNTGQTHDGTFHLLDSSEVTVPMMVDDFAYMWCVKGDTYHAIRLDYGQSGNASMMILLPDTGKFQEVEHEFSSNLVKDLEGPVGITNVLTFQLPRFHFESTVDLRKTLSAMGMIAPFSAGGDFTGISGGLEISYAEHKAAISVDEQGTEATGVTSTMMAISAALSDCGHDLVADRPFIFIIYDHQTNAILFMGRVMNPAA